MAPSLSRFLPLIAAITLSMPLCAQAGKAPAPARAAQQPARPKLDVGFPIHDALTPFRKCDEICGPPDAVYQILRRMRAVAEAPGAPRSYDHEGREEVDDQRWRSAKKELDRLMIDAGHLAEIMRRSRNTDERDLAFFGAFYVPDHEHVCNLIGHIPGEPERAIREKAYPRAIAFLKEHLGRRFGDLDKDQKKAITDKLPQIGSPTANAMGLTRAPRDDDHLYTINLTPFFQLLEVEAEADHAQALWFLKECFLIRRDLAEVWVERALPLIRQLMVTEGKAVRAEAVGLFAAIASKKLRAADPAEDDAALLAWSEEAARDLFPPVRVVSESLISLYASPERDAIAKAGREALAGESVGDPVSGKMQNGSPFRGFRIGSVPDELKVLRIPVGAVVTAVNGVPIDNGKQLLSVLEKQLAPRVDARGKPTYRQWSLLVEYVLDGAPKAIEFRVL